MKAQYEARSSNFSVYVNNVSDNSPITEAIERLVFNLVQSESKTRVGRHVRAHFPLEHTPNRRSQIKLIPDILDDLGMPRVKLEWRNSELDFDCFERSVALLVKELGIHNVGRVQWSNKHLKTPEYLQHDRSHHMGSTRMSVESKNGVVNEHCQLHGVNNLYVAGSSVFPTSGIANPTLTIIALAFRMGDHLHNKLQN